MILREINRRIIAFVALSFFLLSTSGMVLFYHYCQHANELVFSVYVDSTEEICEEYAQIITHHHEDCCNYKTEEKSCCSHHKSYYKAVKLKNDFNFSDRQTPPRPSILSLLLTTSPPLQVDLLHTSLFKHGIQKEFPPEIPLFKTSSKEILTFNHTFKIAC